MEERAVSKIIPSTMHTFTRAPLAYNEVDMTLEFATKMAWIQMYIIHVSL
jgi:hypothetical protein